MLNKYKKINFVDVYCNSPPWYITFCNPLNLLSSYDHIMQVSHVFQGVIALTFCGGGLPSFWKNFVSPAFDWNVMWLLDGLAGKCFLSDRSIFEVWKTESLLEWISIIAHSRCNLLSWQCEYEPTLWHNHTFTLLWNCSTGLHKTASHHRIALLAFLHLS